MKMLVSIGDPNGIGLEVLLKSLKYLTEQNYFIDGKEIHIAGNLSLINNYAQAIDFICGFNDNYLLINEHKFYIHNITSDYVIKFGKFCKNAGKNAGKIAADSLFFAAKQVISKSYDCLLTLPISKESITSNDWNFPGQTEMLAHSCGVAKPLMLLFHENLRVGLATIHIPINEVSREITKEHLLDIIHLFEQSLIRDFAIECPKIAVLGLNPHSGENGKIGNEELDVISVALEECKNSNIQVSGAFPADGFFGFGEYEKYDGIIAMYHDQGLIPLKLLAKGDGVNFTAGLPIVRTSPDHGTAFHIAGKGIADPKSTISAIHSAFVLAKNRQRN